MKDPHAGSLSAPHFVFDAPACRKWFPAKRSTFVGFVNGKRAWKRKGRVRSVPEDDELAIQSKS